MSYIGSAGSGASLGSVLNGATVGGAPTYVNTSNRLSEDFVSLVYADAATSNGLTFGLGVGPVGPQSGYAPPFIGGYQNIRGVLHVEDPGPGYRGFLPEVYLQSHYRGPSLRFSVPNFGTTGTVLGVNSKLNELNLGTGCSAGDFVFSTASINTASYIRIGGSFNGTVQPTLSVGDGGVSGSAKVGVANPNPQATLHAGCGTDLPVNNQTQVFGSNYGDAVIAVRDATHHVEAAIGSISSVPFVGTLTGHDLRLTLNNTVRGIFTQSGNAFFGNTTPATYNPESNVLGLTGFPSAAISIAGNQSTGTSSVGQVAWYNDAAGAGTRVASIQVARANVNNSSSMVLSTMNAGALTPSLYIGSTQWVGILNQNPQAALDVTGSVHFSGPLVPSGNSGSAGQYLQSQGNSSSPLWVSSIGTPGGPNTSVQINVAGALYGATNFTWNDSASVLGITGSAMVTNLATGIVAPTHAYSVGLTDSIVLANATSASFIAALPTPLRAGTRYSIKKTDSSNNIVLVSPLTGTIDGVTQKTLAVQNQAIDVINDGVNYWTVATGISGSTNTYTPTNITTTQTFDATSYTTDTLANVLGSLIKTLQTVGIIK